MNSVDKFRRSTLRQVRTLIGLGLIAGGFLSSTLAVHAQTKGRTVLSLTGNVGTPGSSGAVEFDMAALKALKQQTFTTVTPWDARPVKFSGPLLRDVLTAASANGKQLSAVAVNDYTITLPVEDATNLNP